MVEISGSVTGVESVTRSLASASVKARANIYKVIESSARMLRDYIKKQKLSGQVLKVRSGRLRDSINYKVVSTDKAIWASIYTDVRSPITKRRQRTKGGQFTREVKASGGFPYGKYWETSGAAHGGPRPFLRTALDEKRIEIRQRIAAALTREAIRGAR